MFLWAVEMFVTPGCFFHVSIWKLANKDYYPQFLKISDWRFEQAILATIQNCNLQ